MVETAANDKRRGATATALLAAGLLMTTGMASAAGLQVTKQPFGDGPDGQAVDRYELTNGNDMRVSVITFGARVQAIEVPDKNGEIADVTLGFDDVDGYVDNQGTYFGAIIGRYGNRIAKGHFELNGESYELPINNPPNSLHGGSTGFDSRVWTASAVRLPDAVGVELTYLSPDGEMGYPGNLAVTVRYTLDNANNLRIHYSAVSDRDTVVNLTNHAYFNLAGAGEGTMLEQMAMINAETFTPIGEDLIPTGERRRVADTPLDFTTPTTIGAGIHDDTAQLQYAEPEQGGYDFNWILDSGGDLDELAARVTDPASGRTVEMYTTEPGVQFYTSNFLDGSFEGKDGAAYPHWGGFTLEAQHFPDSPNQPSFPSTVLKAGQKYSQTTIYRFLSN